MDDLSRFCCLDSNCTLQGHLSGDTKTDPPGDTKTDPLLDTC